MASGLGGSGLSNEIKEPLLANYKIFYLFTQSRLRSWYSPSSLWIPRRSILMIPLFLKIRDRGKVLYFKCVKGFLLRWIIPQNEVWNKKYKRCVNFDSWYLFINWDLKVLDGILTRKCVVFPHFHAHKLHASTDFNTAPCSNKWNISNMLAN